MLFFASVSKKAFPLLAFVIGINLGVIMTYLYASSKFANSVIGSSHPNSDLDIEIQDLDNTNKIDLHQSKFSSNIFHCTLMHFLKIHSRLERTQKLINFLKNSSVSKMHLL